MNLEQGKKIFFVSDAHLGLPSHAESLKREKLLVQWLDSIADQAQAIFLVGDIFDFWWEYKYVVPRGFTRLLGKLASLSDRGIELHMFHGNHDMWMRHNFFEKELGAHVHRDELKIEIAGKRFFITHGDGLGPGDKSYKLLKICFRSRWMQWLFSGLHPDWALGLGNAWSSFRKYEQLDVNLFYGDEEFLIQYSKSVLETEPIDYFVYGHRHTPVIYPIAPNATYVNTGDWLQHFSYVVFDGQTTKLEEFAPAFDQGAFPRPKPIPGLHA